MMIGIAGVAGAGKDLFATILSQTLDKYQITSHRYALADALKIEMRPILLDTYGIDIVACDRATKDAHRPSLVAHGKFRRDSSGGRYWTDKISERIKLEKPSGVVCVTDIRYDQYEKDELFWLKEEMSGFLVHVSQFKIQDGAKVMKGGANEEEAKYDPILKSKADYVIEWESVDISHDNVGSLLQRHIDGFLFWLNKNDERRHRLGKCHKKYKL